MTTETTTDGRRERTGERPGPVRVCAGCGKRGPATELVRLVLDPTAGDIPSVVVDVASSSFGRGAHVHPSADCLSKALRGGLSRVFKTKVVADAAAVAGQIVVAVDRRIEGLLMGARRARHVVVGADAVVAALREGNVSLLVVARDAAAAAQLSEVKQAIAAGKAIAWGTKERLGMLLAKDEVAVCGVVHEKVASAVAAAYRMSAPFAGGAQDQDRNGGAWSSSEVR